MSPSINKCGVAAVNVSLITSEVTDCTVMLLSSVVLASKDCRRSCSEAVIDTESSVTPTVWSTVYVVAFESMVNVQMSSTFTEPSSLRSAVAATPEIEVSNAPTSVNVVEIQKVFV